MCSEHHAVLGVRMRLRWLHARRCRPASAGAPAPRPSSGRACGAPSNLLITHALRCELHSARKGMGRPHSRPVATHLAGRAVAVLVGCLKFVCFVRMDVLMAAAQLQPAL